MRDNDKKRCNTNPRLKHGLVSRLSMAFHQNISTLPVKEQESSITALMRNSFSAWLLAGNIKKYSLQASLVCLDRISEYVRIKKISYSIWEISEPSLYQPVYRKVMESKFLRIIERNTYNVFTVVGQLYLEFLQAKPWETSADDTLIAKPVDETSVQNKSTEESDSGQNVIITNNVSDGKFLFRKDVDVSLLKGFTIPKSVVDAFYSNNNIKGSRDDSYHIGLVVEGKTYPATLSNVRFSNESGQQIQVSYSRKSSIANILRNIFAVSYDLLFAGEQPDNKEYVEVVCIAPDNFEIICHPTNAQTASVETSTNTSFVESAPIEYSNDNDNKFKTAKEICDESDETLNGVAKENEPISPRFKPVVGFSLTMKEAVVHVLTANKEPMTAEDIYGEIIDQGLYVFGAQNPVNIVRNIIESDCNSSNYSEKYSSLEPFFHFGRNTDGKRVYSLLKEKNLESMKKETSDFAGIAEYGSSSENPIVNSTPSEIVDLEEGKARTRERVEHIIAWLVTQPNANGTLYLENVVRQYMGVLRTAPAKLDIPFEMKVKSVFACRKPDELNAYRDICKAAPNYKEINSSTSGMFSAALNCYMRYLKHLSDDGQMIDSIEYENETRKTEEIDTIRESRISYDYRRVDFNRPELCAQTKPLTCVIKGRAVVLSKQNWSQLLLAITEQFISESNPNIESLNHEVLYGIRLFFMPQKTEFGTCAKVSNGKWIYTNYNPQTIVTIIKKLCQHCAIDLDDVIITYQPKNYALVKEPRANIRTDFGIRHQPAKPQLDNAVVEKLTDVLSAHFPNGYRLNSPIEMTRFRSFAAEDLDEQISLSDEELKSYIAACGTNYEGKIYAVSPETKERIRKLVEDYFEGGAQVIFFAEFFSKHENRLFEANVVSEDMLIGILRGLFPNLFFAQTYFGYTNVSVFVALENEILRVWGEDVLLTYDRLAERLPYIPLDRIKYALGQNSDFIWSSMETFSHISMIEITDEEREAIRTAAAHKCNARGYASITDLPFGEIEERNYELSTTAIHKAVYRICLSDKFDKKGKIITRKGDVFDALTIMKEYCRAIDKCTLDELLNFEREITGEVHRWIPMEAGNTVLVRIDKDNYVADRCVRFDAGVIDEAIESVVRNDYIPLKSFTTFGAFPDCGQTWNMFLLESYCRRFSQKFRFDTLSVNSRNAGAVIRKSCGMDYTEIMTDAVANADVSLNAAAVGRFLFDSGFTGRSTASKVSEIIDKAKTMRERRD